jgi:hypothetical protein
VRPSPFTSCRRPPIKAHVPRAHTKSRPVRTDAAPAGSDALHLSQREFAWPNLDPANRTVAEKGLTVKSRMPNAHYAFVASLLMLALAAPKVRAQGAPAQPPHADEAAHGFRSSDVASLIPRLVERRLLTIPGVRSVHDLHVGSITSGIDTMSAHVVVTDMAEAARIRKAVQRLMAVEFNTRHVTVQVETEVLPEKVRKT